LFFELLPGTDLGAVALQSFQEKANDLDTAVAVDFHVWNWIGLLDADDNLVGGFVPEGTKKKAPITSPKRKRGLAATLACASG